MLSVQMWKSEFGQVGSVVLGLGLANACVQQVKASEVSKCNTQEARTRARTRTARGGNCCCLCRRRRRRRRCCFANAG
jgi:hypothetical protein